MGTGTLRRGLRGDGGQHVAGARHLGEQPRLHEPSAPTPTRSKLFSGSFDQRFQHNQTSSNRFEYHVDVHVKPMVELHMATAIYTSASDPDVFLPFLTTTASRLLNETNSDLYKRYGNTQKHLRSIRHLRHPRAGGRCLRRELYLYLQPEGEPLLRRDGVRRRGGAFRQVVVAGGRERELAPDLLPRDGTHGGKIGAGAAIRSRS